MKKYILLLVSVAMILIGLIGGIIAALPSSSDAYDVINEFVTAVDNDDAETIKKLTGSTFFEDNSGLGAEDKKGGLFEFVFENPELLPEDAKKVEEVSLVCCSVAKGDSMDLSQLGGSKIKSAAVTAVIKVTYTNKDKEECSFTFEKNFGLLDVGNGYKISSY